MNWTKMYFLLEFFLMPTTIMLALNFYYEKTSILRDENIQRSLELKKDMNNILDGLNIGVIKVTPSNSVSNKVSFCNQMCFNMLKKFISQN